MLYLELYDTLEKTVHYLYSNMSAGNASAMFSESFVRAEIKSKMSVHFDPLLQVSTNKKW